MNNVVGEISTLQAQTTPLQARASSLQENSDQKLKPEAEIPSLNTEPQNPPLNALLENDDVKALLEDHAIKDQRKTQ